MIRCLFMQAAFLPATRGTFGLCFHSVGNVIIPIDFHSMIFQRGREKLPTSHGYFTSSGTVTTYERSTCQNDTPHDGSHEVTDYQPWDAFANGLNGRFGVFTQRPGRESIRMVREKTRTLWLFNIAMEKGPFIDGLPIRNGDFPWLC